MVILFLIPGQGFLATNHGSVTPLHPSSHPSSPIEVSESIATPIAQTSSVPLNGKYLMAFYACDTSRFNCTDPSNDMIYLAQSNDSIAWSPVPGFTPYSGSVPDTIRRGNAVYLYTPLNLVRFHLDTGVQDPPVSVSLQYSNGTKALFVDPSIYLDPNGTLHLFYLPGVTNGDPAQCPSGQTNCTKLIMSATEVAGSDGGSFIIDPGERINFTITQCPPECRSDPALFPGPGGYYLYISAGQSILAYYSTTLKGRYTPVSGLGGGILVPQGVGGVPAGYYDNSSSMFWTFVTQSSTAQTIARASTPSISSQINASSFTTVVSGCNFQGLGCSYNVGSPGFHLNVPGPSPAITAFVASPATITLGGSTTFTVTASGGTGVLSYAYVGLPSGCITSNNSTLSCRPTATGSYVVRVYVNDSVGHGGMATTTLTVIPGLSSVSVSPTTATLHAVGTQTFTPTPTCTGGACPAGTTYSWSLTNSLGTLNSTTGNPVLFTAGTIGGTVTLFVNATLNGVTKEARATITISSTPVPALTSVSISPSSPTVTVRATQSFSASPSCNGGACPSGAVYAWSLSNSLGNLSSSTGSSTTFTAGSKTGTVTLTVETTLNGKTAWSNATITVRAGSSSGFLGLSGNMGYILMGVIVTVVVIAAALLLRRGLGKRPASTSPPKEEPESKEAEKSEVGKTKADDETSPCRISRDSRLRPPFDREPGVVCMLRKYAYAEVRV